MHALEIRRDFPIERCTDLELRHQINPAAAGNVSNAIMFATPTSTNLVNPFNTGTNFFPSGETASASTPNVDLIQGVSSTANDTAGTAITQQQTDHRNKTASTQQTDEHDEPMVDDNDDDGDHHKDSDDNNDNNDNNNDVLARCLPAPLIIDRVPAGLRPMTLPQAEIQRRLMQIVSARRSARETPVNVPLAVFINHPQLHAELQSWKSCFALFKHVVGRVQLLVAVPASLAALQRLERFIPPHNIARLAAPGRLSPTRRFIVPARWSTRDLREPQQQRYTRLLTAGRFSLWCYERQGRLENVRTVYQAQVVSLDTFSTFVFVADD